MASSPKTSYLVFALSFLALFSLVSPAPVQSQPCSSEKFKNGRTYSYCNELSALKSSLHYTYDQAKSTLSLAFVAAPAKPEGWIAWAINPTAAGMVGAQTLMAFRDSGGKMAVKTYNVTSYGFIKESPVWFKVAETSAESSDGIMRLFATVVLPKTAGTSLNHVWQVGSSVNNGVPNMHDFRPENLNAKGTLDLLSGVSKNKKPSSSFSKKNIHAILNAVSWGILFPIGIIIARYLRAFESANPVWFYAHGICQLSGYVIGVVGWATGMSLGSKTKGVVYSVHRNIGMALFALATVQIIVALFLRPDKEKKLRRLCWNIFHQGVGYAIVVLSIVNVFKGIGILSPDKRWKVAYMIVLIVLGAIGALLEAITWAVVLSNKYRKNSSNERMQEGEATV